METLTIAFLLAVSTTNAFSLNDDVYTPYSVGQSVVGEVSDDLNNIFPYDYDIMKRTACAESDNGLNPNTFRDNYHGGIWQVDRIGFEDTQNVAAHPGLQSKFERIEDRYGIDWTTVGYTDLTKPLYSGIAARLYYSNNPDPIPENVYDQATYWKNCYNTNEGAGSESRFLQCSVNRKRQAGNDKDINDFINCPNCVCRKFNFVNYSK